VKTSTLALVVSLALLGCTSQTAEPAKADAKAGDAKAEAGEAADAAKDAPIGATLRFGF
jgi:hypothetical protein